MTKDDSRGDKESRSNGIAGLYAYERTLQLLEKNNYQVFRDSIFKINHLGELEGNGAVKIFYHLRLDVLEEQLELRDFLKEKDIRFQERDLDYVQKELTQRSKQLTRVLEMIERCYLD
jgi:hypothetical protein